MLLTDDKLGLPKITSRRTPIKSLWISDISLFVFSPLPNGEFNMLIRYGNEVVNTDHIAHAHFFEQGDRSTSYTTPCVVITFSGGANIVVFPHHTNPEAVWGLIVNEAVIVGKES